MVAPVVAIGREDRGERAQFPLIGLAIACRINRRFNVGIGVDVRTNITLDQGI